MKRLLVFVLLLTQFLSAQSSVKNSKINIGLELDALPYITGGYYFSSWGGYQNFRLRGVIAKVHSPSFIIPDGFEELNTNAYTILLDYFPHSEKNNFEKWWIGTGLEYWNNSVINSSDKTKDEYNNIIFTIGGGYVLKILGDLYINPWIAAHIPLTGRSEKIIGNKIYQPKLFLYEASFKLGWYF